MAHTYVCFVVDIVVVMFVVLHYIVKFSIVYLFKVISLKITHSMKERKKN